MTRSPVSASSEDPGAVLAAFSRVLAREEHVLRHSPELLWQQLYNRLQWEDDPVRSLLVPEFERRSVPGASPWLRTRTPPRESEALIRTLEGHNKFHYACAYSPDGSRVVSAGGFDAAGELIIWDAETGEEIRTLKGHTREVKACAYSPDGSRVVSASKDGTLKLWDAETGEEIHTLRGHAYPRACAYSPDGSRVVSASSMEKTFKIWDAETGEEIRTLEGHTGAVDGCAFSPDGSRVVSASWDETLKLWDAETGEEIRTLKGHTLGVDGCAFSPDGSRVVSASGDGTLKLWDAETGDCVATLPLLGSARSVAHHPHRASVACGDAGGAVYLVDLVGITLGPLIVTAVDLGDGPSVCCPVCLERHPFPETWLGRELYCPGVACHARLRVNSFVARRAPAADSWIREWWSRWRA
jgi:WD40 repeat protein